MSISNESDVSSVGFNLIYTKNIHKCVSITTRTTK